MKIVFFTNKTAQGAEILKKIKHKNIPLAAIIIDTWKPTAKIQFKKLIKTQRRIGFSETFRFILKKARKLSTKGTRKSWQRNDFYQSYSEKVYLIENFNGKECEQILKEIEPDLIILGGARIIRQHIIDIPKIGLLNAHPGLLPQYRGVDVIRWAIYHGDPVGVTIHFVDSGVDTGGIVAQEIIDITKGDTAKVLMKKANVLAGMLMTEVILELMEKGFIKEKPQAKEAGKQYYRMPVNLRQEAERKLQNIVKEIDYEIK